MSRNPPPSTAASRDIAAKRARSRDEIAAALNDPFIVFSEWAGEADEKAYGGWSVRNLRAGGTSRVQGTWRKAK